jgi:flagellar protein FlgJ
VAIAPPTDIVLGVALAADPQKYRAAVERLQRLSASRSPALDGPQWQAEVAPELAQAAAAVADANPAGLTPHVPMATGAPPRRERNPDAFAQLEAFVLQTFIQSMLPKDATHVFGKGTAGEVWKSMLAEKLGHELARSGQVGLAKRLRAGNNASHPGAAAPMPTSPSLASVLPYLQQAPGVGPTSPEGAGS